MSAYSNRKVCLYILYTYCVPCRPADRCVCASRLVDLFTLLFKQCAFHCSFTLFGLRCDNVKYMDELSTQQHSFILPLVPRVVLVNFARLVAC